MSGCDGGDLHRPAAGAGPGHERAVGEHLAVAKRAERHRDAAAVGAAGGADRAAGRSAPRPPSRRSPRGRRAPRTPPGRRAPRSACPSGGCSRRAHTGSRRFGSSAPARHAPAAVAHAEHGVAVVEPLLQAGVAEPELRPAPAVEDADDRKVAVRPAGGLGREADVDVDRGAVERGEDARAVALAGIRAGLDVAGDLGTGAVGDRGDRGVGGGRTASAPASTAAAASARDVVGRLSVPPSPPVRVASVDAVVARRAGSGSALPPATRTARAPRRRPGRGVRRR